jgi:endonuclease G, mitochondrial
VSPNKDVNEGIRISAIVAQLKQRAAHMNANQQSMLRDALNLPPPADFGTRVVSLATALGPQSILAATTPVLTSPFFQPVEGAPLSEAGGAPASRIDRRYGNRRGYNERFLRNFTVPMPQLNTTQRSQAARVRGVGENGNPFELKYEHFSVILNSSRRMAFFSIVNIDGSKRIKVDRATGQAVSEPEAAETWAIDPRVPEDAQLNDAFYDRLRRDLRTTDFFARGHLTRREDPDWGTAPAAEKANDDTFHHTNACPQAQNAFDASQKVWAGIENFVLNSADDANLRVTVITGPVSRDDDPTYQDEEFGPVQLPRRFWKVVTRVEDGQRKVFAVLADQSEAMDALFQAGGEARGVPFAWPNNLSREFRSTVAEITQLTGLDFGDLANHDVFADGSESMSERIILGPESLVPRPVPGGGFGRFRGIGQFLDEWESSRRRVGEAEAPVECEEGEERMEPRHVPSSGGRLQPPQARQTQDRGDRMPGVARFC